MAHKRLRTCKILQPVKYRVTNPIGLRPFIKNEEIDGFLIGCGADGALMYIHPIRGEDPSVSIVQESGGVWQDTSNRSFLNFDSVSQAIKTFPIIKKIEARYSRSKKRK